MKRLPKVGSLHKKSEGSAVVKLLPIRSLTAKHKNADLLRFVQVVGLDSKRGGI